jgi:hypothetical protein
MSRLETPLLYRTLWATGDVLVRAELELRLKTAQGARKVSRFRVDSGAEITTMPAWDARGMDLPMPQRAAPGVRHQQTGLEVRSGLIRAQVVGMDATEYVFPCFFLGDPGTPIYTYTPPTRPHNLLGLSGVVDKIRITLDGKLVSPVAPYGHLIIEKL